MAESERRAVGFHRTLGQGRGCRRTRRDGRGRSDQRRVAFTSSFSVSEVSIDPSANEFCNPIKTFPSVVIKSLSKGYLDIARSGKTFRVPTIFLAIPRNRPLKTFFSNRGLPKKKTLNSLLSGSTACDILAIKIQENMAIQGRRRRRSSDQGYRDARKNTLVCHLCTASQPPVRRLTPLLRQNLPVVTDSSEQCHHNDVGKLLL